ncbi:zinc-containing alcohol dehydrogenase [Clohesyomyces aquaticus]|uniref:Zinc-containing alcohol dehydrogenase n=1 Tax=Clohesyomyces aquaticus TaxID=1231657 RepID=A0A1Y1ZWD1_9PLEO|nr:zinc-containing alcohol dehydrogenase [Clohesyomyces aquaticus]
MHAAIVGSWGSAPKYSTFNLSAPSSSQVRIKILAAGLHNLVRSRAAGQHYTTANKSPPHIPGVDGVGTISETGELFYFNCLMAPTGSFAEEIIVEKKDIVSLPAGADPHTIAVLVNPAMSSWMAFTTRAGIVPGQSFSVAIVGATGVSGQAAVQISKAMGATEIVAIGRPGEKLEKTKYLGATATIALADKLEETDFSAAGDVDVVLDYLWGETAKTALPGIVWKRANKSQRLTWVEIGALAGNENPMSAALLRQANVAVVGCGPGSWTFPELGKQLPTMLETVAKHGLKAEFVVKKLEDVESWWEASKSGPRVLVKP